MHTDDWGKEMRTNICHALSKKCELLLATLSIPCFQTTRLEVEFFLPAEAIVSDQDLLQQMYIIVEGRVVSGRRTMPFLRRLKETVVSRMPCFLQTSLTVD